jgi:tyrosyl-tRNA synthetase
MGKEIALRVATTDHVPMYGIGGKVVNIWDAPAESVAAMLNDRASEALAEWEDYHKRVRDIRTYRDFVANEDPETVHGMQLELEQQRERLADGLADVIVAACDLAKVSGVRLQDALNRNKAWQTERGRIDG